MIFIYKIIMLFIY